MKPCTERIYNGVIKENPTLVLMLGMCPTLAVTTSCMNGFGMGVSTLVVLVMSNLVISALRKVIPDAVRLPAYIVIVASLVTVVELLMEAYVPDIYDALGISIFSSILSFFFFFFSISGSSTASVSSGFSPPVLSFSSEASSAFTVSSSFASSF